LENVTKLHNKVASASSHGKDPFESTGLFIELNKSLAKQYNVIKKQVFFSFLPPRKGLSGTITSLLKASRQVKIETMSS